MNPEIRTEQNRCKNQSDWLSQVDNVNDIEASQVNGGSAAIPDLTAGTDLIGDVTSSIEEAFATQAALQEIMLDYQIRSEALRSISEGVQKNIDVVENERQDISQGQE